MKFRLSKLDGRYAGNREFSHRVSFVGEWRDRSEQFVKMREWCWEMFGAGVERNLVYCKPNTRWAWHIDESPTTAYYIYLKEESLTHFQLKWM